MTLRIVIVTLVLLSLGATMPSTQSSSSSSSSRRSGYSDRYGLLEDRNIFVRERSSRRSTSRPSSSTQPAPRSPEERFVLTGVVFEEDGFRAYVEDDRFQTLRLAPGDKLARGRVAAIVIDAIAYEPASAPGQRTWVDIGCDLTGKPSSMLASSSSASFPTTSPTTGPVVASDVAGLNPNDPNLTPEQKMKLRRAMELQKK